MPDDPGHHYTFGQPKGGWPVLDADGNVIREEEDDEQPEL